MPSWNTGVELGSQLALATESERERARCLSNQPRLSPQKAGAIAVETSAALTDLMFHFRFIKSRLEEIRDRQRLKHCKRVGANANVCTESARLPLLLVFVLVATGRTQAIVSVRYSPTLFPFERTPIREREKAYF